VRETPSVAPVGPIAAEEVLGRARAGQWPEALVCPEDGAEWRPILSQLAAIEASTVPAGAGASYPPPAPQTYASLPPRAPISLGAVGLIVATLAALLAAIALSIVLVARKGGNKDTVHAVVRVVMKSGVGTGFFVAGPDEFAYVATAYHVVASGEPVLIERILDAPGGRQYPEAYPDAEVVAFDADADLAIIRLNGVVKDRFPSLPFAKGPTADESVLSYGFPGSSLAHKFGMVSKPGKVLSLVKFPVFDHRTDEIIRSDAISGLLVSADIEPGFSGGPTCNERGEVVGVNVTKDLAHRGQNGAVDVAVLRDLLAHVKPVKDRRDPTTEEVKELLGRIEREYLLLPIDRRKATREDDFVSADDLPRVGDLITTIRRLENDTSRHADTKISGAAGLGLVLARLPGHPFETYTDRSTRKAMADCEVRERGLREFFGSLASSRKGEPSSAEAARAKCSELAFRAVVWDLTALAVQWTGQPREIAVSKLDSVDPDAHVYRAAVRFGGVDHLVDVWLATDGGRLRLKLFDSGGEASGLSAAKTVPGSDFAGKWRRSDPRTAHNITRDVQSDIDTDETLGVVVSGDGNASVTHQLRRHIYMTGARRLACGGATLQLGIEQTFTGILDSGTVIAGRDKEPRALGADMARCSDALGYVPDFMVVLKLVGDKMLVYRTDGIAYPELTEFTREL
jgi:S1-C subfamily serine protease